jgi:uncharacterized membrane protein YqaE (UPF0057 family)
MIPSISGASAVTTARWRDYPTFDHRIAAKLRLNRQRAAGSFPNLTNKRTKMRLLLALVLPWLQFFTIGRPIAGIICLLLQLTVIGWIPAAIWSVYALSQYKTDKKIERALASRR